MREIVVVIKVDDEDEDANFKNKTDEEIMDKIIEHGEIGLIDGWYILDEH